MNIQSKISELKKQLSELGQVHQSKIVSIPADWIEVMDDGELKDPPETANQNQLDTFNMIKMMWDTIK